MEYFRFSSYPSDLKKYSRNSNNRFNTVDEIWLAVESSTAVSPS